jgi:hypothetical protein
MNEHWTLQEVRGRLENILFRVEAMIHNLDNASDPQEQAITVGDLEDVRTGILDLLARRSTPQKPESYGPEERPLENGEAIVLVPHPTTPGMLTARRQREGETPHGTISIYRNAVSVEPPAR